MNGLSEALIARAVDFHGHKCPGLALGLRAAGWVLENRFISEVRGTRP